MGTRTIAVDSKVYARLAAAKNEGESFSKTIDRLLDSEADRFSGADILRKIAAVEALTDSEAAVFVQVVDEARLKDSLLFVRAFRIGNVTLETAIDGLEVLEYA